MVIYLLQKVKRRNSYTNAQSNVKCMEISSKKWHTKRGESSYKSQRNSYEISNLNLYGKSKLKFVVFSFEEQSKHFSIYVHQSLKGSQKGEML